MRRYWLVFAAAAAAACANFSGARDAGAGASDFDRETRAADQRVREDAARSSLGKLEASIADYYKTEKRIPSSLDMLIPKYLAEIPILSLPVCGRDTSRVEVYPPDVLRGGQVDGTRLNGTGRWGYVFNDRQVVVFVDCLKVSSRGVPWYQERGAY